LFYICMYIYIYIYIYIYYNIYIYIYNTYCNNINIKISINKLNLIIGEYKHDIAFLIWINKLYESTSPIERTLILLENQSCLMLQLQKNLLQLMRW